MAFIIVFVFSSTAWAAPINWNNSNSSGDWGTASNWSTNTVPSGADAVTVDLGGTAIINSGSFGTSSVTVGNTAQGGTVHVLSGSNLNVGNGGAIGAGTGGVGTLVIDNNSLVSGNSFSVGATADSNGTITIDDGRLQANFQYIDIGYLGVGKLTLNKGSVTAANNQSMRIGTLAGSSGEVIVNGGLLTGSVGGDNLVVGRSGTGTLIINGSGRVVSTWTFVGGEYRGGNTPTSWGGNGTIIMNDDSTFFASAGIVIGGKDSVARVEINDNATFESDKTVYFGYGGKTDVVVNGGLVRTTGFTSELIIGYNNGVAYSGPDPVDDVGGNFGNLPPPPPTYADAAQPVSVILNRGAIEVGGVMALGYLAGSSGTLIMTDGRIQANYIYVGRSGVGELIMTKGTLSVQKQLAIGAFYGSRGTMTMTAGTANITAEAQVGRFGTGIFNMTGGLFKSPKVLVGSHDTAAHGTFDFNGGVMELGQLAGNLGTSTVNLNGGVLKATAANPNFIEKITNLNVLAGGAIIDSNGFAITLKNPMTGAGDAVFTKKGAGTLTVDSDNSVTYGGEIIVEAGTLALSQANTFRGAVSTTLKGTSILDTLGTVQTLGSLNGEVGTNINAGSAMLTLNNLLGHDSTFSGTMTNAEVVNKIGGGALTLNNNFQMTALNHNEGTLNIAGDKTVTVTGAVTVDGAVTVLGVTAGNSPAIIADTVNFTNGPKIDITGFDPNPNNGAVSEHTLIQTSGGITGSFTPTVGGAELGTFVDLTKYLIGTVYVDPTGKNLQTGLTLVWNNPATDGAHGTFNIANGSSFTVGAVLADKNGPALGFGWNGETLTKTGGGDLILNAVNTYTGLTDVQAGRLIVGETVANNLATIAGDVNVQSGAVLGGHGRIAGDVHLFSGAKIAPGHSVGTITVGNIIFDAGSIYEFEAYNNGSADKITATGVATINGGAVHVLANGNIWSTTNTYNILTAAGGVTGTYDSLTSNLAFLDAKLTYDANNVYLNLIRNTTPLEEVAGTGNQTNTGNAIEQLGSGNPIYDAIVSMDAATARNAYDNLSGEIHASLNAALLTNSRFTRTAINQHLSLQTGLFADQPEGNLTLWGNTWGHSGYLKGNGNAARTNNKGMGVLLGFDRPVELGNNSVLGLAAGYEQTEVNIGDQRNSEATIDALHFLLYGATSAGPADLRFGVGYAWLQADTERDVWVGAGNGLYRAESDYDGYQMQLFIEGSHTFVLSEKTSLIPYLNVAYTLVDMDSFTEKGSIAALHGNSKKNDMAISTLGTRGQIKFGEQSQHSLYGDLGWQHYFSDKGGEAELNFAGGLPFSIKGVEIGQDNAVVGVGGNFKLREDIDLSVGYEGVFGNIGEDHGVKVQLGWRF